MQSRIQLIREAYLKSPEDFAKILGIDTNWLFMAENTLDSSDIPEHVIDKIYSTFHIPKKFILGYPYKVRRHFTFWNPDERHEYLKANFKMKKVLTAIFGYCDFDQ